MTLSVDLDNVLAKQRISLQELSERTGFSTTDLKTLSNVQFIDPRFSLINQICVALECDISDILKSNFTQLKPNR